MGQLDMLYSSLLGLKCRFSQLFLLWNTHEVRMNSEPSRVVHAVNPSPWMTYAGGSLLTWSQSLVYTESSKPAKATQQEWILLVCKILDSYRYCSLSRSLKNTKTPWCKLCETNEVHQVIRWGRERWLPGHPAGPQSVFYTFHFSSLLRAGT